MSRKIELILFDLGGTLWDDTPGIMLICNFIKEEFQKHNKPISSKTVESSLIKAVKDFSPSINQAMIFNLCEGDIGLYNAVRKNLLGWWRNTYRNKIEECNLLIEGASELIRDLTDSYKLCVASNNQSVVSEQMNNDGIPTRLFEFVGISESLKISKPDPLFFRTILSAVGGKAENTIMVGDRRDNDIAPANHLGMTTVLVHSPIFCHQQPRYLNDVADFEVQSVLSLTEILSQLS